MMTVKATAETADDAFTLLEAPEPPNFGPSIHIHRDAAEAFYIIEGEYRIFIEDQRPDCPAGSFVHIPAEVVHGFRVDDAPSKNLNCTCPSQ
jgi:mannose-6-phosphate isomerase-like protein (cupin superfamily)